MGFFGRFFGSEKDRALAKFADVKVWKTGPAMIGAVMFTQFIRGDRLLLADDQLDALVRKAPPQERHVQLWICMYVSWLLLLLAKAKYGEEFGREVMAAVYGRIATNEDRAPGIDAIANGYKFYFKRLDDAVQHAIKNLVKIKGQEVPPVFFMALAFLATDERYEGQTDPDFKGFDLELATLLAEAQDISKPRLDDVLASADALPRPTTRL